MWRHVGWRVTEAGNDEPLVDDRPRRSEQREDVRSDMGIRGGIVVLVVLLKCFVSISISNSSR